MVWPEMEPEELLVADDDELQAAAATASEAAIATAPARASMRFLDVFVIAMILPFLFLGLCADEWSALAHRLPCTAVLA